MATMSITSNDGALDSASAVLEVTAINAEYNQPALRIKQASCRGGAASIRIDDPNPDIEFVETDQDPNDPAKGKYEIAVQSDEFQINGRNATNSGFETILVVQRLAAGGRQYWLSHKQPIWRRSRRDCDCECDLFRPQ
jgi:hypothetical protein